MSVLRPLHRSFARFMAEPASIGKAARLMVGATVATVFAGSLVVWIFDKRDFSSFGEALWFMLQTVTTVGYGDVTPKSTLGRVVGGIVMLFAIGFITIVTAAVTSTFVEAARRRQRGLDDARSTTETERLEKSLAAIAMRLDRIEQALAGTAPGTGAEDQQATVGPPAPDR